MLHIELKERIETTFDATRVASVTLRRDALDVSLANGVELTLRIAGPHEYAIAWRWGDAEMRIDTAPRPAGVDARAPSNAAHPNHLHTPDGRVVADPVTKIGAEPWRNVRVLIERLADAPLLGHEPPSAHGSSDARAVTS
ncbi:MULTISPECIES: hypothetical protein [Burkholderia]|uniref:hypothetical protein n=1 Tax=Burkholderia TaxID=32008 RepID=UPI00075DDB77|nr:MULTISPECIES: hypothetical protein [Burkholderia]AOJ70806.1 hypothetical protein WS78_08650 [Burkholderia savannae]KVG45715.1 hypothetical protein WS77_06190 [Burkholderia sp. MSMB0265]KVG87688.1 hypothetical protein WS81_26660 [Burkholderia sp. MSMB2040]KVG99102.1 hypothetical protein WS83_27430 [Burkholderia sp. MSMB2042]KVG99618.1 hypothetical protein WS82_24345 [Burkholderia sp. MSMB2041]